MNEASTSISMELIPGAYEQPIICDGNNCSFDYEGTWIACNTISTNPGGDDSFAARRETLTIGSGKGLKIDEFLTSDDGTCNGPVGLTIKYENTISDNGSTKKVTLGEDNVSASMKEITFQSVKLSFKDLSYINGLKPDNETYLCGESYWTGVENEITGCSFKHWKVFDEGDVLKIINFVTDNNTLRGNSSTNDFPDSFNCIESDPESTGEYLYPVCDSSSSSSGSSGGAGININLISDNTTEAGGTAFFSVKLDTEPTASVTIPISSDNVSEGTVSVSSLTFTSSNWNSEQTVTVTGVDDSVVDDNVTYNVVIGSSTSSDVNYDGVDVDDIILKNINNDILIGGSVQGSSLNLSGAVTTLAGNPGSSGFANGTGTTAKFNAPWSITTDGTNIYVADYSNHLIRRIVISSGVVTTFAGTQGITGSTNGTGTSARFSKPAGITSDGNNLYLADRDNHLIRKIVISSGVVTTLAGSAGNSGTTDATGTSAKFYRPMGITTDGTNLYVSDTWNSTIRKIVISTGVVSTLAGSAGITGTTDGNGTSAKFNRPIPSTTDGTNLYIGDGYNHTIRKIVISSGVVTTIAGLGGSTGNTNGTGTSARFNRPWGICSDGRNIYVADVKNHLIRKIVISSGVVTTLAGSAGNSGTTDATGTSAKFYEPISCTTNGTNLYVSDYYNHTIRKIQ